jgi:chaperone required for assembly of F1-ATPase
MTEWAPKRFWTTATADRREGGHGVILDARPLRTPEKREMVLPTSALANAVAAEWNAQGEKIVYATMPMTRMANTAIDRVSARHGHVAAHLARYGETDLLCYRAEDGPRGLAGRQAAAWDPLLDWAADTLGARLRPTKGVMPISQPSEALDRLSQVVAGHSAFELTALHDLVTHSGSLVLGLAVARGELAADEAWARSRIDEEWQAELWGRDDEAEAAARTQREGFLAAHRFLRAAQQLT